MKIKSPTEPILMSDKSMNWLEEKLRKNESRHTLNNFEKELYSGAKSMEKKVRTFI
ncbi:MAG: hypothetical protein WC873_01745 [Candidatus Gracilibacteria bacterium]